MAKETREQEIARLSKNKNPSQRQKDRIKTLQGRNTKDAAPQPTPEEVQQKAQDKALGSIYGNEGVNAGNALMQKFMPEGALGRVSTDLAGAPQQLQRQQQLLAGAGNSDAQKEALSKMQGGLSGYTSGEYQASREQMMRGQQSNYATSQGQLAKAQARGKVYGAAGAAQMANLSAASAQSKDQLEQDLMVKNIDEQQRRLQDYGKYASDVNGQAFDQRAVATKAYGDTGAALRGEELDRQKINLGQSNAELASQIGLFTGAAGTNLSKEQNEEAMKIQKQGINVVAGGGGGSSTNTNTPARTNSSTNTPARTSSSTSTPAKAKAQAKAAQTIQRRRR